MGKFLPARPARIFYDGFTFIRLPTKDDNGRGPNEVRAYCPSETWLKGKGEQIPAIAAVSCERCLLCASLNIAGIFFPGLNIRRKRAGRGHSCADLLTPGHDPPPPPCPLRVGQGR